ncbi:hypothetical protein BHS06_18740 [Myxococcus xanthus]|uniref:DUF3943 domain-containing protein n=1 Tax=Myxococcus xanthus TaxID=34 RepID=UPI001128B8BC|nr:DUF3943 domain-containing protein [Myxococcus xanthus]QDE90837.1 hypothetical protein BHS06_18740 [Myxococcus xanthus]
MRHSLWCGRRGPAARWRKVALLVSLLPSLAQAAELPADAPRVEDDDEEAAALPPRPRQFWWALGEVTAINLTVWGFNRYVMNKDFARVGLDAWRTNLEVGFVWDKDDFSTNQFAHPYHGSTYFNAARDHGFNYWGAMGFTLVGSLQWELFAENHLPSYNDLINTTMGGWAHGEVIYRLSSMLLDQRATGTGRVAREVSAGLLNPVRGFNRVVRGDAWRSAPTPEDWQPPVFAVLARTGYLNIDAGTTLNQFFAELDLRYGDALRFPVDVPFDAFNMGVQFTTGENRLISRAEVKGALAMLPLENGGNERVLLGAFQHFDYNDTQAYELGGQSIGAGLVYRYLTQGGRELRLALHLRGVVLAGITSEYADKVGRDYDYGPGLGFHFEASYGRWPWEYLKLHAGTTWLHTLNGADGNHLVHEGTLLLDVPLFANLGLGASFTFFERNSFFRDFDTVSRGVPQARVFISVH